MPQIIAIEYSEAQRRQLAETLAALAKSGRPLSARYEAADFPSWHELFSTIIQPGLFASRESIVIEGAESLETFPDDLASVVEDDKADCAVVLVFSVKALRSSKDTGDDSDSDNESDSKKTRGVDPVKKYLDSVKDSITIIKAEAEIPPWKRKDWLTDLARAEGAKVSPDAAQLLADSIESQEELRTEILKLAMFTGKKEITVADVEAFSFDEGGSAGLMLIDGVCDNKPRDVAQAVKHLRGESILPMLAMLTNRLRPALVLACFPEKLHNDALIAVGTDPAKKFNYALTKSRTALKNYGAESIKRFMIHAARLAFLEKTGRAEGWEGFELIIWELMAKF